MVRSDAGWSPPVSHSECALGNDMEKHRNFVVRVSFVIALLCWMSSKALASGAGFVYVMTNDPNGNSVIQYSRASDGSLTQFSEALTDGLGGTGNGVGALDPLGSQDSLVLAGSSVLIAVNAGGEGRLPGTLSALRVDSSGLHLLNSLSSGGSFPHSVAVNGNLVYVLNAHSTPPNITGFKLSSTGLTPIRGSTVALPGFTAASSNVGSDSPHDIRFSPDGTRLIVSEGVGSNLIDVVRLNGSGLVTAINSQSSAGQQPFGIRFGRGGVLLNAEADSDSVSSYLLNSDDTLAVISPAISNGQTATCWISVKGDGKFGFTSNTGAGDLSAYQVSANGTLTLAAAIAATADGGNPIDSAFSSDSAFLYAVDSGLARILVYRVNGGSLSLINTLAGLPSSVQGIAAQ